MIDQWAAAEARRRHPALKAWSKNVLEVQREQLATTISRRCQPLRAEKYRRRCPVPGATAEDYILQRVDVGGASYLVGIHFFGLNIERPYLGILARTGLLDDVDRVATALYRRFAVFRPQSMQLFQSGDDEPDLRDRHGAIPDQRLIAGHTEGLPPFSEPECVTLRIPEDLDALHHHLQVWFSEFREDVPGLADRVHPLSSAMLKRQHAREVWVDNQLAGAIAGSHNGTSGLEGVEITEEILGRAFRGRGLAVAAQRTFLRDFPDAIAWGRIDTDNHASMKTALRVGRIDLGGWTFVPFTAAHSEGGSA